jgi:hypothetical protein
MQTLIVRMPRESRMNQQLKVNLTSFFYRPFGFPLQDLPCGAANIVNYETDSKLIGI